MESSFVKVEIIRGVAKKSPKAIATDSLSSNGRPSPSAHENHPIVQQNQEELLDASSLSITIPNDGNNDKTDCFDDQPIISTISQSPSVSFSDGKTQQLSSCKLTTAKGTVAFRQVLPEVSLLDSPTSNFKKHSSITPRSNIESELSSHTSSNKSQVIIHRTEYSDCNLWAYLKIATTLILSAATISASFYWGFVENSTQGSYTIGAIIIAITLIFDLKILPGLWEKRRTVISLESRTEKRQMDPNCSAPEKITFFSLNDPDNNDTPAPGNHKINSHTKN